MHNVLILDNNDSFTYNLIEVLRSIGGCNLSIVNNSNLELNCVENFDKILFSPGPGIPSEFPAMFDILNQYGATKSILGVCLGHQAIGEYFGGKLINLPKVYHGIKTSIRLLKPIDKIFEGLPEVIDGGLYHSWAIDNNSVPSNLRLTATSDDGIIMGISHVEYDICGVQFHPESIMTPYGRDIISNWLE